MVARVYILVHGETVRLDPDRLHDLFRQLGETGAQDVLCRAIEELAVRLAHCERLWRDRDPAGLHKGARSLIAIAEQIGMGALARVAGDVMAAIETGDSVTIAATLARLLRIGELSLSAVWDSRDLSV